MTQGEPAPSVFVMGAGVVGTALAAWLGRAGVPLVGLHGRQSDELRSLSGVVASVGEIPDLASTADVVVIAVRDERIPEVAKRLADEGRLRDHQVLLHTSGALASAGVLAVARPRVRGVGTLHPLLSFADARLAIAGVPGVAFAVEGDASAREAATRIVRALGARVVTLDAKGLPLYHAGAVLASNYVVALGDLARRLLLSAGVPADEALPALVPLMSSVVQNLAALGLPGALTGPVERGDASTVEAHLRALAADAPELVGVYQTLGRDVLRLAREKSGLAPDVVARLASLFGAPPGDGS
ncbi:MAG TPA: Rossmann-like and DUF2520 domain-containing protein [Polyangia bacterium]|nr:Rossmann-like and DUF2520 domain-containing protein [Polyangia bacterium]